MVYFVTADLKRLDWHCSFSTISTSLMGKQNFDVFLRQEMRLFMYVNVKEEEMAFLRALLRPEDTLGGKKAFFFSNFHNNPGCLVADV